jgi:hypothetical protein
VFEVHSSKLPELLLSRCPKRERERERESLWQHFTSSEMKSEEKRREEKKKMK